jgi:hypothetical protein
LQESLQGHRLISTTDHVLTTFLSNTGGKFASNLRERVLHELRTLLDDESYELHGNDNYSEARTRYPFISERVCSVHARVTSEFIHKEKISFSARIHTISLVGSLHAILFLVVKFAQLLHVLADEGACDESLYSAAVDFVLTYTSVAPFVCRRAQRVNLVQLLLFADTMFLARHAAFLARSYVAPADQDK